MFCSESKYPVGRMEINPIENLIKISVAASTASVSNKISLADIDYVSDSDDEAGKFLLQSIDKYC